MVELLEMSVEQFTIGFCMDAEFVMQLRQECLLQLLALDSVEQQGKSQAKAQAQDEHLCRQGTSQQKIFQILRLDAAPVQRVLPDDRVGESRLQAGVKQNPGRVFRCGNIVRLSFKSLIPFNASSPWKL
jgi:hypothetical protein